MSDRDGAHLVVSEHPGGVATEDTVDEAFVLSFGITDEALEESSAFVVVVANQDGHLRKVAQLHRGLRGNG